MYYQEFLKIIAQLSEHCKASVIIEDKLLFVEKLNAHAWRISCNVFSFNAGMPTRLYESLSSSCGLKWQEKGPYLKLEKDSSSVVLMYDINASTKYLPFREALKNFLPLAQDWNRFFEEKVSV